MPKTTSKKTNKDDENKKKKDSKKTSKKTTKKAKKEKKEKILKPYCGIQNPIPKNYRLGSMEECLNAGKVNYYGIKKIDSRLVDSKLKETSQKTTLKNLNMELMGILGKENKLRKDLASAKTVDIQEKIKKDTAELKIKKTKLLEKISELSKK